MYEQAYAGSGFEITAAADRPFAYRYTSSGGGGLTLRGNVFQGNVNGTTETDGEYLVTWITSGQGTLDVGRDEVELVPGRPTMFPTGRPQRFDFRDYRQNIMHFEGGFLEDVAAEVHGDPRDIDGEPRKIRFHHATAVSAADLVAWNAVVAETARVLMSASTTELVRAEVNRAAARAVLRTFPHETFDAVPEAAVRTVTLRQAIEFMQASAHLPISTPDVARFVGVTVRGLQQTFSRHLGTTPTEYLRAIRLDHVRAELLPARTGGLSIADVAARWGFAHAGRFSASYAARFGEHPRETLAR